MRILGVDPGLVCTGYGGIDAAGTAISLAEGGTVRPPQGIPLAERLRVLHVSIAEILDRLRPDVTVVEEVYSKYTHPRTAILMGHARGVIMLAAAERGIEVAEYAASRVKMALSGSGRASKDQVGHMVARVLGLPHPPEPADVADALALAACHAALVARQRHTVA